MKTKDSLRYWNVYRVNRYGLIAALFMSFVIAAYALPHHRALGKKYYNEPEGRPKAFEEYLKSIELKEENHRTPFKDSAYYWGYLTAVQDLKKYDEAVEILHKAAKIWPDNDEIYWILSSLHKNELKNPEKAAEYLRRATKIWPDNDEVYWRLSSLYKNELKNPEKAAEYLRKGIEMVESKADECRKTHMYHYTLAKRYELIHEYEKAFEEYRKQVESGEEARRIKSSYLAKKYSPSDFNSYWIYSAFKDGGDVAIFKLRRYSAGIHFFEKALEVCPDVANLHWSVGWDYESMLKDYETAQKHYRKAIELSHSLPNARCDYIYDGDSLKPRKVWRPRFESEKRPHLRDIVRYSCSLAKCYLNEIEDRAHTRTSMNVQKAHDILIEAYDTSEKNPKEVKNYNRWMVLNLLARVCGNYPEFEGHDKDKALQYALQALETDKRVWPRSKTRPTAGLVGVCYLHLGNYEEAIKYLKKHCKKKWSFGYPDSVFVRYQLSQAYQKLAEKELGKSLEEVGETELRRILSADQDEDKDAKPTAGTESKSQAKAANAIRKADKYIQQSFSWMECWQKATLTDKAKIASTGRKWRRIYDYAIRLKLKIGRKDEAFKVIERGKGRAMLDLLATAQTRGKQELQADSEKEKQLLLSKIDEIQEKIKAEKKIQDSTQLASLQRSLVLIQDKARKLAEDIANCHKEVQVTKRASPLSLKQAQGVLAKANATLIQYWGTDYIAVVSKDAYVLETLKEPVSQKKVQAFRDAILAQSMKMRGLEIEVEKKQPTERKDEVEALSKELYDTLIRPVEQHITTDLIFIAPDGALAFLPFQALYDGKKYLVEKYSIAYTPSASVLKYCMSKTRPEAKKKKKQQVTTKVLALGNPNLREAKYKLVHAEEEVKAIAQMFPEAKILVGNDANEKAVQLLGRDFDIVHFACHGTVNLDDPMLSCLRLSPDKDNDGYLHAGEIFDIDLRASLVTLSACESGLGKITYGSEVLGLTRAFMFAGTPSVVASLWKVDDAATAKLMVDFYGSLQSEDKAQALRNAQVKMIKEGKTPFYWAGFCLYGDNK